MECGMGKHNASGRSRADVCRDNAAKKSKECRQRVAAAIQGFISEKKSFKVSDLAERAGVSRQYIRTCFAADIQQANDAITAALSGNTAEDAQQSPAVYPEPLPLNAALELASLRQRLRNREAHVLELVQETAVLYGKLADRTGFSEAEWHEKLNALFQRVTGLEN